MPSVSSADFLDIHMHWVVQTDIIPEGCKSDEVTPEAAAAKLSWRMYDEVLPHPE